MERQRGEAPANCANSTKPYLLGSTVLRQIGVIEDSLNSAGNWGTWDLIGGGLISDMAKHSHLDNAQQNAEHLQVLLQRFKTELTDVYVDAGLEAVNIDGFLRFADFFFDGLIKDMTVLRHIRDSQESVRRVKQQVTHAMAKLQTLHNQRSAEKRNGRTGHQTACHECIKEPGTRRSRFFQHCEKAFSLYLYVQSLCDLISVADGE